MTNLHLPPIQIPSLVTTGNALQVIGSGSPYGDITISMSDNFIRWQCMTIIREEIAMMKKKVENTIVDYERLQSLIESKDLEMNNLAYSILDQHTKYCSRLIKGMKTWVKYDLEAAISEYTNYNYMNITDSIR